MEVREKANRVAVERIAGALLSRLSNADDKWVVPIYGAGASIFSGVPSGNYLMQRMRADLIQMAETPSFLEKMGKDARTKADRLQYASDLYFEEVLDIYGRLFGPEVLYHWLKKWIKKPELPYFPSFTHEYCAHLVSSGFLKYFMSANFDEILEDALEDELGHGSFHRVASLSEFQQLSNLRRSEWDSEFGHFRPRCYVFKPHGTISRVLSLRHLPRVVESFEPEKILVLKEVLKGSILLFLGFGNYNHDYWELFLQTFSAQDTNDIVIVDRNPSNVLKKLPGEIAGRRIYSYEGTTDDFFGDLAARLHSDKSLAKRQRPTRHQIRSLFFGLFSRDFSSLLDDERHRDIIGALEQIPKSWYFERIYELELLIYLFKTRGLFVDLAAGDCRRIAAAYDRCHASGGHPDLRVWNVLDRILNRRAIPLVASSSVQGRQGLDALNTRWCFLVTPNRNFTAEPANDELIFQESAEAFGDWIRGKLPDSLVDKVSADFCGALARYLEDLSNSFDIDITDQHRATELRFRSPTPLRSRSHFAQATSRLVKGPMWDRLRVATVAGEWLVSELQDATLNKSCTITILSNLDMFTSKTAWTREYRPLELVHFRRIALSVGRLLECMTRKCIGAKEMDETSSSRIEIQWFAMTNLGHHMTIASCNDRHLGGIYFSRLGKNTSITPVSLEEAGDLDSLSRYFDDQVSKASLLFRAIAAAPFGLESLDIDREGLQTRDLATALEILGIEIAGRRQDKTA